MPKHPKNEPLREGDPLGSPSVLFDDKKRQNYHLGRDGEAVYHEVPEGYRFDKDGVLVEKEPADKPAGPAEEKETTHG